MIKTTHKQKDGATIPIASMSNQHLVNTIKMILRNAQENDGMVTRSIYPEDAEYEYHSFEDLLQKYNFMGYAIELARRVSTDLTIR